VTWVLVRKELREHWAVLLGLAFAALVGYAGSAAKADDSGSQFVAVRIFSSSFALLMALVVCNRLVVRRVSGRTQLFLEAPPSPRLRVVTTKLLHGAGLVALRCSRSWALRPVARRWSW
jgi:cytochrome b561